MSILLSKIYRSPFALDQAHSNTCLKMDQTKIDSLMLKFHISKLK